MLEFIKTQPTFFSFVDVSVSVRDLHEQLKLVLVLPVLDTTPIDVPRKRSSDEGL